MSDIVSGIIRVWSYGKRGEVYNLGNPANTTTIANLAREVAMLAGVGSTFEFMDGKDVHGPLFEEAPEKVPNADKAIDQLYWYPTRGRTQVIQEVLDYWRHPVAQGFRL